MSASASYRKDPPVAIGLCHAPPTLSKEAFENGITAMVDTMLATPAMQKNCLKLDMLFQTELAGEQLKAHGVTKGPHGVWLIAECATVDNFLEMWQDPMFVSGFREEMNKIYGHGNDRSINTFLADVQTRIDLPRNRTSTAKDNQDQTRLVAAIRRPENIPTADEFREKVRSFADKFVEYPICQRLCVKHEMWTSNSVIDPHLRALGLSAPDPDVAILMVETEHQDGMIQILNDSDFNQFMEDARRELDIHVESSFFVANVVTKLDK
ncbi:hypothetical protein MSAN_02268200 [Mycena sanguinolenta]|uniref:Uncharacterized protein n=1 Tax=Mycena sanguinolenta TaxID=230812 RepID=A0A8H6XB74_9AGAR|nr:hypothetical protein MSAN_02268200 [Mycena sanguinolenta]